MQAPKLEGWKQIADSLGRDVSTAMRWARERGLPVHRIPGGKKQAVFAYADELDRWLRADSPIVAESESQAAPASAHRLTFGRQAWLLTSVALLAAGATLAHMASRSALGVAGNAPEIGNVTTTRTAVVASDRSGTAVWSREFSGVLANPDRFALSLQRQVVSDIDRDGAAEALVSVPFQTAVDVDGNAFWHDELYSFDAASGRERWSRRGPDQLTFRAGTYRDRYVTGAVTTFDVAGTPRIAWATRHGVWWPSQISVLDGSGRELSRFVHAGHVERLVAFQSNGRAFLLGGGISNSREAAAFFVLDAAAVTGAGPEEPGSRFECLGCPAGQPLHYFVFPTSELALADGFPYNRVVHIVAGATGIQVQTAESRDNWPGRMIYQFSADFQLEHADFDDSYWLRHRQLEAEGKLGHAAADCPDRKRSPRARRWTPEHGWTEITPTLRASR